MRRSLGLVLAATFAQFITAAEPAKPAVDEEKLNVAWKKFEGKWKSVGVLNPDGFQEYTREHKNFDYSLLTRDGFTPIRDGKSVNISGKFVIIDPTANPPSLDWYDNAETLGPHRKCIYRFKDADTLQVVYNRFDCYKRPTNFEIRQGGKEHPVMLWFERVKDNEKKDKPK